MGTSTILKIVTYITIFYRQSTEVDKLWCAEAGWWQSIDQKIQSLNSGWQTDAILEIAVYRKV